MDQRGSCLPGGETSLDEGPHASGSSGSDPPAVSAAVDELLSSTPSSMLWGEGEGTRIKAEVRAFLNGLSHLLLEDEELDSEVRQGVDGFFEQLPSMSWEREGSAGEPRGAVEEMVRCLPPLARGCPSLGTGTQEAVDANLSQSLLDNDGGGEAANAAVTGPVAPQAVLLPVLLHTVNGWRGAAEAAPATAWPRPRGHPLGWTVPDGAEKEEFPILASCGWLIPTSSEHQLEERDRRGGQVQRELAHDLVYRGLIPK
eukprot:gene13798-16309_t